MQHLLPIQMGEKEAGKVLAVDRNVSNQYFAMEDEAVTMAEYQMLYELLGGWENDNDWNIDYCSGRNRWLFGNCWYCI